MAIPWGKYQFLIDAREILAFCELNGKGLRLHGCLAGYGNCICQTRKLHKMDITGVRKRFDAYAASTDSAWPPPDRVGGAAGFRQAG
jgi:hypothetical protein